MKDGMSLRWGEVLVLVALGLAGALLSALLRGNGP